MRAARRWGAEIFRACSRSASSPNAAGVAGAQADGGGAGKGEVTEGGGEEGFGELRGGRLGEAVGERHRDEEAWLCLGLFESLGKMTGKRGAEFGEFRAGEIRVGFGLSDGALERFVNGVGADGSLFARRLGIGRGAAVATGENKKYKPDGEENPDPFRGAFDQQLRGGDDSPEDFRDELDFVAGAFFRPVGKGGIGGGPRSA